MTLEPRYTPARRQIRSKRGPAQMLCRGHHEDRNDDGRNLGCGSSHSRESEAEVNAAGRGSRDLARDDLRRLRQDTTNRAIAR